MQCPKCKSVNVTSEGRGYWRCMDCNFRFYVR
jgi:ribosomal protein L37AE/L43A